MRKFAKVFCLVTAFFISAPVHASLVTGQDSFTVAKVDSKEKSISVKKGPAGKKPSLKPKIKSKAKGLKAKVAPPPKAVRAVKKVTPLVTKKPSAPVDWGFWFLIIVGFVVITAVAITIWYEYRPTINASGVVYGEFEFLPAHQGGAFTSEFHGNSPKQPLRVDPVTAYPATVTREPLHADSRSTSRPSVTTMPSVHVAPVKKAQ